MHVTVRRASNVPSFRQQRVGSMLLRQIRRLNDARFQIVHFSIQSDHIDLIVEAEDRATITRKMSGLMIAFAKRLNRHVLGNRRGKVWADRYSRRDITTAAEMHRVWRDAFRDETERVESWDAPVPRTRVLREDWTLYDELLRTRVGSAAPSAASGDRSRAH